MTRLPSYTSDPGPAGRAGPMLPRPAPRPDWAEPAAALAQPLSSAKWGYTTRRVDHGAIAGLDPRIARARPGDLLLCEVTEIGQHTGLQLTNRRKSELYPGDLIVVCLGDRYAPDQFLAVAEADHPALHMVAGGGLAGRVEAAHDRMEPATELRPLARVVDGAGEAINIADHALSERPMCPRATVIAVFGTSMNAGKTTAACALARGLSRAGKATMGLKVTGTGAFGDVNAFEDSGVAALDFTDAGMASTFRMAPERVEAGFATLVATATEMGAEVIVAEIADGLFHEENRQILQSRVFRERIDAVLFAAPDALSAMGGQATLTRHDLAPLALSGVIARSPLATREAGEATGLPVLTREELCDPDRAMPLFAPTLRRVPTAAEV